MCLPWRTPNIAPAPTLLALLAEGLAVREGMAMISEFEKADHGCANIHRLVCRKPNALQAPPPHSARAQQETSARRTPRDHCRFPQVPADSYRVFGMVKFKEPINTLAPWVFEFHSSLVPKMTPKPQNSNSHTDFGKDPLDIEAKLQTDHVEAATGDVISLDPKDPSVLAHIQDELAWAQTLSPAEFAEVERKLVRKVSLSYFVSGLF
jgi:hypothetical protein